jgi:Na+-translocating ferredoxin:NAD+ oxidoreductase RNF subunit RnfB
MYEGKDGNPSRAFIEDADRYMSTFGFGRALLNADPPQMRTIPVNRSIEVEPNRVATFDQVEGIVASAQGPFVVIPCICRERKALHGEPCQKTTRRETCLGFNEMAAMILARGHGREVDREEVLDILEESQKEGLVLQPANTRSPDFICSCCGCCCGMLNMQKMLPHPAEFWARRFMAYVDHDACSGCGRCVDRCQVGAVSLSGKDSPVAVVNDARCIGCGLCVTTCRPAAIRLQPIEDSVLPPRDEDELYEEIKSNRRGAWAQFQTLLRVAIGYLRQ